MPNPFLSSEMIQSLLRGRRESEERQRREEEMMAQFYADTAEQRAQDMRRLGEHAPTGYGPVQPGLAWGNEQEQRVTLNLQQMLQRMGMGRR